MFEAAVEHFTQGLALLAQQDISAVPPRQLGADIKRIRGFINRAEAQCVRRVELFDREQAYGSSGDTSTPIGCATTASSRVLRPTST
jgi:hypothetical protein